MRCVLVLILFTGRFAAGTPVILEKIPHRHFVRWIRLLNKNSFSEISRVSGDGDPGQRMIALVQTSFGQLRPDEAREIEKLYQGFGQRSASENQIIKRTVELMREISRPQRGEVLHVRRLLFMYMQAALVLSRSPLPLRLALPRPDQKILDKLNHNFVNSVASGTFALGLLGLHFLDSPYDDEALTASLLLSLAGLRYLGRYDLGPRAVDYLAYLAWQNSSLKNLIRQIAARVPGGPIDEIEQVRWFFDAYFNRVNSSYACGSQLNVL